MSFDIIRQQDRQVYDSMMRELERQRDHIELIASENFVSSAVMQAMGSHLTNKYAEGYPAARYYGGCQYVDEIERLAIDRAKQLFGAEHANVQPHSGSQANVAVYLALLKPGDTILGMDLSHGGHLTHGSKASISGKYFNACFYGVDKETERIDYDAVQRRAEECRPKLIIAGASAYSRVIDFARMRQIADSVGAYLMVDMAHIAGLVAAGCHPSPFEAGCDIITTTTHKTLRGPRGGLIFCKPELAKKIDSAVFPGSQGGPLEHVIAAKAVAAIEDSQPAFHEYARKIIVNCKAMADEFVRLGYDLVTGGTDNHLFLVDLTRQGVTGKALQNALDECNITLNKNCVPNEQRSPQVTSGVRIGTAAMTTKGMTAEGFIATARVIDKVVKALQEKRFDEAFIESVKAETAAILAEIK